MHAHCENFSLAHSFLVLRLAGSRISQPRQARLACIVRPAKRHIIEEEHALLVPNERLHLQPAQAAERCREADRLELAVGQARARRYSRVLAVRRNFVTGGRAIGVTGEDQYAGIGTSVVAARHGTDCVEPESRVRFVTPVTDLTWMRGADAGTVRKEDREMW